MGKSSKRTARQAMERRMDGAATPRTATGPPKVQSRVSSDLEADAAAAQVTAVDCCGVGQCSKNC